MTPRTAVKNPYTNFWLLDYGQRGAVLIPLMLMIGAGVILGTAPLTLLMLTVAYGVMTLLVLPSILRGGNVHAQNDSLLFLIGVALAVLVSTLSILNPLFLLASYQVLHAMLVRITLSYSSLKLLKAEHHIAYP